MDLLRAAFGTLFITTEVYGEVRAGLAAQYHFNEAVELVIDPPNAGSWLRLTAIEGDEELRCASSRSARLGCTPARRLHWLLPVGAAGRC